MRACVCLLMHAVRDVTSSDPPITDTAASSSWQGAAAPPCKYLDLAILAFYQNFKKNFVNFERGKAFDSMRIAPSLLCSRVLVWVLVLVLGEGGREREISVCTYVSIACACVRARKRASMREQGQGWGDGMSREFTEPSPCFEWLHGATVGRGGVGCGIGCGCP